MFDAPLDFLEAYFVDDLHASARRSRGDDRRSPRLEPSRIRRIVGRPRIELERVDAAKPPGQRRLESFGQLLFDIDEGDARDTEQILQIPSDQDIDVELVDIDLASAERLVGIDEEQRTSIMS